MKKSIIFFSSVLLIQQFGMSQTKVAANTTFEENRGQIQNFEGSAATEVKYHYQEAGVQVFILATGIAYQFNKRHYPEGYEADRKGLSTEGLEKQNALESAIRTETYRMDMQLLGSNKAASVSTEGKSKDYVNYYTKNVLDVHRFSKLTYHNVYPNIDWVIYSTTEGLKYDFIVHPGGNPAAIKMKFVHQEDLKINPDGSFTCSNRMGQIREKAPVSFQGSQKISSRFVLEDDIIAFELGAYDKKASLRIDPTVEWATYYGSTEEEHTYGAETDALGNVYITGHSSSSLQIASGGYQNNYGGGVADAFLVKFNSVGVRQWATYYGGDATDVSYSCAIDLFGNVYMGGATNSATNIAFNGHQNNPTGADAFLVKFNSAGVRQWATYYGGNGGNAIRSCAVDGDGNIYATGETNSSNNIAFNGHQNTLTANGIDAFLVKFNTDGQRLWATYYGGDGVELGNACVVDLSGNVYLAGTTGVAGFGGSTFNIASSGHQNSLGGGYGDAFLVKFNPDGLRLWATYYGGSGYDEGHACSIDPSGNVYLAGRTTSLNGIASGGYQNTNAGGTDAFLVKFNNNGTRQWATFYGGSDNEHVWDCTADILGNIYIAGTTRSVNDIAFNGVQNIYGGDLDAFLLRFDPTGGLLWGSYYGGNEQDAAVACPVYGTSTVYLAGYTKSSNNIALNGHQNTYQGGISDAFLVKIVLPCSASTSAELTEEADCAGYTLNGQTYKQSGIYTQLLANAAGCDSIITLNLTILDCEPVSPCEWLIPNAFTPNNDGNNDHWGINCIEYNADNQVSIYNRWGQLVYTQEGYSGDWDGTQGGKPLPDAAYYYILVINSGADKGVYKGSVAIIR